MLDDATRDQLILVLAFLAILAASVTIWRRRGDSLLAWAVWLVALIPVIRRL